MSTLEDLKTSTHDPIAVARFINAFAECSTEIQNYVLEMASIIGDPASTPEERELAYDALTEALSIGLAADVVEDHKQLLRRPESLESQGALSEEELLFANRLRAAIDDAKITQEDLAKKVGVSQPAIANMLARQCRPQRRTVLRLAEALSVEPEALWPGFSE